MSGTPTTYLIVDKITGKLDWDGELHSSIESALTSLCDDVQSYVRTEAEVTDEKGLWSDVYDIRRVLPLTGDAA